jgi:molybdate transport system substrate-binding protein
MLRHACLALCLMLLAAGCPRPQSGPAGSSAPPAKPAAVKTGLVVWADPALQVPLEALLAGSGQLEAKLNLEWKERGEVSDALDALAQGQAPAWPDVFILADVRLLGRLREAGVIDESTGRTFAGDRLVLIQQRGAHWQSATLFDIYRLRFEHLAVGSDRTAAGYYGQQALVSDGLGQRLESRLLHVDTTGGIATALTSGKAQLALVFASLAAHTQGVETTLLIGTDLHEDIRYQAVAAAGRTGQPGAQQLLRLLAEDAAFQQQLQGYGLLDRKNAMAMPPR